MPLSQPVSYHVIQKLKRVLGVFHATPVSVPITTHNGFVSDLLKWALKSRFYSTGPCFLYIKNDFKIVCFDEHQNSSGEWLTDHPFSRVPKFFPFLFSNPKLISLFRKKKQPLLPFLRFTVWNSLVEEQEQERPFVLKSIRGSTVSYIHFQSTKPIISQSTISPSPPSALTSETFPTTDVRSDIN